MFSSVVDCADPEVFSKNDKLFSGNIRFNIKQIKGEVEGTLLTRRVKRSEADSKDQCFMTVYAMKHGGS